MSTTAFHAAGRGSKHYAELGCRCIECLEARRLARKRVRDRTRAENRPSYQRELAASRRLKQEVYGGTCEHCGARTTGCEGPGRAPTVCATCAPTVYGPKWSAERLGKGPVVEKLLAYLSEPRRYMEIRQHLGITQAHTGVLLNRHVKSGLILRLKRGVYIRAANSRSETQQ